MGITSDRSINSNTKPDPWSSEGQQVRIATPPGSNLRVGVAIDHHYQASTVWSLEVAEQPSLFSETELQSLQLPLPRQTAARMSLEVLQTWKQRVFAYQQQVKQTTGQQQVSLFGESEGLIDPDSIDPFTLPQQNTQFWRWKFDDPGLAALYFVIDYELPLLLYVGETVKSNRRWKGKHDCKDYLLSYRQIHYHYQLPTALGIAFWSEAPDATQPRQKLESALIYKWRSPFNKENCQYWNTPFVDN